MDRGTPNDSVVGAADYPAFAALMQELQKQANANRIPGATDLQTQSSSNIAGLLNPPALFPDTLRMAAEQSSAQGIAGSGAAYSTAVKMSDEERLKRMALGEQFLTGALARNPAAPLPNVSDFIITPAQQAYMDLQRELAKLRYGTGGQTFRGGGGALGGGSGHQLMPWSNVVPPSYSPPVYTGPTSGLIQNRENLSSGMFSDTKDWTLDDAYEWLGFGGFGSLPGDVTVPGQPGPPTLDESYYG